MPLNDRQRRFVEHYVALGVATRAAIAAGYKDGPGIREVAHRLLTHVDIAAAIDARQANLANELGLTRQWVLNQLQGRAEDPEAADAARIRATELIGKAHGMFTDRAIVDTTATVIYQLDMGGADLTGEDEEG